MSDVNVSALPIKKILGIFIIRTYLRKIVIAFMLWSPCLCGGLM
uniref:Alternative protein TMEM9B n=1 Tax=Homo sapiens TaxID=9606 RepID=L8E8Z8_HUMAN|nr:alternative protein TMEM9B [Homo sapiens]